MMVRATFTLLATMAAAIAGAASAQESSQQAQLGVTATVVRPAEIIGFPSPVDGAIALIRNSEAIEVVVDGGTVRRRDGEAIVLPSSGASSVIVTLVF